MHYDLDSEIASLESQMTRLKQVRDILADKQLCDLLRAHFTGKRPRQILKSRPNKRRTKYDELRQFFLDRNNEWATLNEVTEVGFSKGTARQIMYIAKPKEFEREATPGGGRETKFRLTNPAAQNGER